MITLRNIVTVIVVIVTELEFPKNEICKELSGVFPI